MNEQRFQKKRLNELLEGRVTPNVNDVGLFASTIIGSPSALPSRFGQVTA